MKRSRFDWLLTKTRKRLQNRKKIGQFNDLKKSFSRSDTYCQTPRMKTDLDNSQDMSNNHPQSTLTAYIPYSTDDYRSEYHHSRSKGRYLSAHFNQSTENFEVERKPTVFLSYSKRMSTIARKVCKCLRKSDSR
jgi:hypothetical protein